MNALATVRALAAALEAAVNLPAPTLRTLEADWRFAAFAEHYNPDRDEIDGEGERLAARAEAIDAFLFDRAALRIARTLFNELGAGDRADVATKGEGEARAWFAAHGVDRPGGAAAQLVALCRA